VITVNKMADQQEEMVNLQPADTKSKPIQKLQPKAVRKDSDYPFIVSVIILQIIIIVLYAVSSDYNQGDSRDSYDNYSRKRDITTSQIYDDYPPFQDIHGMMFVGFGFLMTFLRKYGFSAISFNFLLCGYSIQWAMLVWDHIGTGHIFHDPLRRIVYTTASLVDADVAVATILISFGAVLGRASPTQLLWMSFFELIIYSFNGHIFYNILKGVDPGGSITIHTFGAYWGLAASWALGPPKDEKDNKSMYQADLFSMIGTLFLWLYWPSFNSFYVSNDYWARDRAVLNTVLALCGSIMSAYLASKLFRDGRFEMVHVQNATLAGGVVMGAVASLYVQPAGAMAIGITAGFVSVVGYCFVQDFLKNRFKIYDTCGVHNLHGMPGILGCIASAVAIRSATDNGIYHGGSREELFHEHGYQLAAGRQILGVMISIGLAVSGGLICGFLWNLPKCFKVQLFVQNKTFYKDVEEFDVPEGELDEMLRRTIRGKEMAEGIAASEQLEKNNQ